MIIWLEQDVVDYGESWWAMAESPAVRRSIGIEVELTTRAIALGTDLNYLLWVSCDTCLLD